MIGHCEKYCQSFSGRMMRTLALICSIRKIWDPGWGDPVNTNHSWKIQFVFQCTEYSGTVKKFSQNVHISMKWMFRIMYKLLYIYLLFIIYITKINLLYIY